MLRKVRTAAVWCYLLPDVLRDKSSSARRGVLISGDIWCRHESLLLSHVCCFVSRRRNQLADYYSSDQIKGDEMGGSCGTNEGRNACVVLMGKYEGKKPLGITGRSCERDAKWFFKEI